MSSTSALSKRPLSETEEEEYSIAQPPAAKRLRAAGLVKKHHRPASSSSTSGTSTPTSSASTHLSSSSSSSNITKDSTGSALTARCRGLIDRLSPLSNELLHQILGHLPLDALLPTGLCSHRFHALARDPQLWKALFYTRFVRPRARRIPSLRGLHPRLRDQALDGGRAARWLGEGGGGRREAQDRDVSDGGHTGMSIEATGIEGHPRGEDWFARYRTRHRWDAGVCKINELEMRAPLLEGTHDGRTNPRVKFIRLLANDTALTMDEWALRAWDVRSGNIIAEILFEHGDGETKYSRRSTCLAIHEWDKDQEQDGSGKGRGGSIVDIAVGFRDGGWSVYHLDIQQGTFEQGRCVPPSLTQRETTAILSVAYAPPYILSITWGQELSLHDLGSSSRQKHILTLQSRTAIPPLSLSLRLSPTSVLCSIAYTYPVHPVGSALTVQEIQLDRTTHAVTLSRIASSSTPAFRFSALPGLRNPTARQIGLARAPSSVLELRYAHPYLLCTRANTLTLHLVTSTPTALAVSPGKLLWGHGARVWDIEMQRGPRARAVTFAYGQLSADGDEGERKEMGELRVWDLEAEALGMTFQEPAMSPADQQQQLLRLQQQQQLFMTTPKSTLIRLPPRLAPQDLSMTAANPCVALDFNDDMIVLLGLGDGPDRQVATSEGGWEPRQKNSIVLCDFSYV